MPSEPNDFEEIFDFFSKCILDKAQVDITPIKRRLIEEFEKAHNTPPPTPHDDEKTQKVQKTKKAVDVLRTATQYQASARTQRAQQVKQSPILHQAREPKPLEILSTVASVANDPAVHDNLQTVEHLVMGLLSQKLGETQDSKTKPHGLLLRLEVVAQLQQHLLRILQLRKPARFIALFCCKCFFNDGFKFFFAVVAGEPFYLFSINKKNNGWQAGYSILI